MTRTKLVVHQLSRLRAGELHEDMGGKETV